MYVNVKSVTVLQMKAKSRLFVDKMHFMIATTSRVIFKPFHVPFKGEPSISLTLMTLIVFEGVNERRIVRNPKIKSFQKLLTYLFLLEFNGKLYEMERQNKIHKTTRVQTLWTKFN